MTTLREKLEKDGYRVNPWNDRYYVNIPVSRGTNYRGDRTTKIWYTDLMEVKNEIIIQSGKGMTSREFYEKLNVLKEKYNIIEK